jgi:hypothetical protein
MGNSGAEGRDETVIPVWAENGNCRVAAIDRHG